MLLKEQLEAAARSFLAAALIGDGRWESALEDLSRAADARGATLVRVEAGRTCTVMRSPGISDVVSDYVAGRTPPDPRSARVRVLLSEGFRTDGQDFSAEELASEPYYQEFLRPHGYFWHGCARLAGQRSDEIDLSFKRALSKGPYNESEVVMLDAILPELRAAARIGIHVLDAKAKGVAQVLRRRGVPVYEFDSWSRVVRSEDSGEAPGDVPVRVVRRRLTALDGREQPALDAAVAAAARPGGRPQLVRLTTAAGRATFLQIIPVAGEARDLFGVAVAVAVLISPEPQTAAAGPAAPLLREALRLTEREAEVAALIGEGCSITEVARTVGIAVGTARNHVKSVYEKTGTSRQAQLVALLAKLRP